MAQGKPFTEEERSQAIEVVIDGLRKGMPEYAAAEAAGCGFVTWWKWQKDMPGLRERAREAKLARVPLWEDALHKAALKGSVSACLALLEKHDPEWKDRAKDLRPQQNVLVVNGGIGQMISTMEAEKKQKLMGALHMAGLLPDHVIDVKPSTNGHSNGNGSNGSNGATNGNGAH